MSIPKNYFTDIFSGLGTAKVGQGYALTLDFSALGRKLDIAQDILDAKVWDDMQQYMPVGRGGAGGLKGETNALNASIRGEVYYYPPESDYGHYLYEGIKYVDPITGKGAFYSPEYGFWSRPGVKKVPSGESLIFRQPNATAHWGDVAFKNHHDAWVETVRRALQ